MLNEEFAAKSSTFNRAFSRKAIETAYTLAFQTYASSCLSIEHSAERQLRPDARERFPPVVCGGGGAIRVEPFGCAGALRTCRSASLPCKELPDVLSTVGWLCFAVDEWRNKILWVRGDWTDVRRCPNALLQTQTMR